MNKCLFTGNLGADPELKETAGGMKIATVNVAVNGRSVKQADGTYETETEWITVKIFGDRAVTFSNVLNVGDKVELETSYHKNTWVTDDGENRSFVEFIIDRWRKITPKSESASASSPPVSDPGF
jgi:single-strand DNA-binding protein